MQANKTITINGRRYDAVTGLPIEGSSGSSKKAETPLKKSASTPASAVHSSTQRSKTLHRRAAKKPATNRPAPGRHMDIARSSRITRFAPQPKADKPSKEDTPDRPARVHSSAKKAFENKPKPTSTTASSKQVKEAAITAALGKTTPSPTKQKSHRKPKLPMRFVIITLVFAVLIFSAFLVYTNVPSISVAFASTQAGIKASYPEYRPDGYRFSQPVSYSDGRVVLNFISTSGAGGYTITQERNSWDSSAVLDNVVRKDAGDNYITTKEKGLTIYTYDSNSKTVWVNGGILYTITNQAPLSGDQLRRIATSL